MRAKINKKMCDSKVNKIPYVVNLYINRVKFLA